MSSGDLTRFHTRGERLAALLLVSSLLLGACMRDAKTIDWDLSSSHTLDDIDWPEDRMASRQIGIDPIASLSIIFPGGLSYEGAEDVRRVWVAREGNIVYLVQIDFEPQTIDDAYQRARELAADWNIPTDDLDEWYETAADDDDPFADEVVANGEMIKAADAGPFVEIRYSFSDEKPALVSLSMAWRIRSS